MIEKDLQERRQTLEELRQNTPEYAEYEKAKAEERAFKDSIGLLREEAKLEPLKKQTGLFSGMSGRQFEMASMKIMTENIFSTLREKEFSSPEPKEDPKKDLILLTNLTMGSSFEIDQLIVLRGENDSDPVTVLAYVEAKRNVNDIAKSFTQIQTVIGWCTGTLGKYDPAIFRSRTNPTGHFEKPIYHEQDGVTYTV